VAEALIESANRLDDIRASRLATVVTGDPNDSGFRINRGIPAHALTLGLDHEDDRRTRHHVRLMLACGDIPANILATLRKRGVDIHCVGDAQGALDACRTTTFDVLVCDPSAPGDVPAFIRLLKDSLSHEELDLLQHAAAAVPKPKALLRALGPFRIPEEEVPTLQRRYTAVPVFMIKPSSQEEYVVILRPPAAAFVEHSSKVPIERAILGLDVGALLRAMGPLA